MCLTFSCPYLARKLNLAVPVFAGLLYLCVISFIFRTACSDPGILPRATQDEVTYLERSSTKRKEIFSIIEHDKFLSFVYFA